MQSIKFYKYRKCPKISYIKVSDKMACVYSVDPDQTASEGAFWPGLTLHAILLSTLRNDCIESKV